MSIEIGVNIPNFGPYATAGTVLGWVRRAEDAGMSIVMMSDHVTVTADVAKNYRAPFLEAFTTLAWLSGQTALRIGTTVAVIPYRHRLLIEAETETLARLSGGRFVLGVGVGWAEEEFRALGVPYGERASRADEALASLAAHRTDHKTWPHSQNEPGFAEDTLAGVPVWVGGNVPAAIRRAVRYGTGWHPLGVTSEQLSDGLHRLSEEAGRLGRTPPALIPRIRLNPTAEPGHPGARELGHGTWSQVECDLSQVITSGSAAVILDTYLPTIHAAAKSDTERNWTILNTAVRILRSAC